MAIAELLAVVSPPSNPINAENGNHWTLAEQWIGFGLPDDFRDFATHYGSGKICGNYLGILNPLSTDNFQDAVTSFAEVLRDVKRPREYPYDVFPDRPGLLPWGSDENGNYLHWLTEGEANAWPIIVESHEGELERFDMSMTTFLAKALTNEIRPKHIWRRPFTQDERVFTPST